jgi:hypothetical protein
VYQRGRLDRMAGALAGQTSPCDLSQLGIHHLNDCSECVSVPVAPRVQQSGHIQQRL